MRIWLAPMEHPEARPEPSRPCLPIPSNWLGQLRCGDIISFVDARDAWRTMEVMQQQGGNFLAQSFQTSYLTSEIKLRVSRLRDVGRIGNFPSAELPLVLKPGDLLIVTKNVDPGVQLISERGDPMGPARISITLRKFFRCAARRTNLV